MTPPPNTGSANVTLDDVARHVGVSARTVSRVVNNEGGCSAATQLRIRKAIEDLGYRPNMMARGLITRRSDTIGLIAAELLDPFFPEIAEGVERSARAVNRTLLLASTNSDRELQRTALASLQGHGVDGVIVFPAKDSHDDLIDYAARGLPIVVMNQLIVGPRIASITADIQRGAELAIDHLLRTGRKRIVMLVDRTSHRSGKSRRVKGYRAALTDAGLNPNSKPNLLIEVENSLDGGRHGVRQALATSSRPDAIFAYNDLIALGALQELLVSGVAVPDDIALVGFDDIAMCQAVTPQLTSVRIDRDLLARTAVETLYELLENSYSSPEPKRLPVGLVVRGSSSP